MKGISGTCIARSSHLRATNRNDRIQSSKVSSSSRGDRAFGEASADAPGTEWTQPEQRMGKGSGE